MAAVGTVLSVVQTLFAALDSPVLKEICSIWGYRSEFQDLKNTVSTVMAVLLDAETKQDEDLSNEARDCIEKLKYAVYDADDLLDEFTTLAEQKQLLEGGKISKEVRVFFSRYNQLGVAYTMSRGIKKIRKKLDAIARDHTQFCIGPVNNEPIRRRSRETCSYVYEQNIIGRDDDKKVIIDMLLDPQVQGNVSFVTIVGIGGLGKTALAQLVYNDEKIINEFPLRLWVCVSDEHPKPFDIKAILCRVLESATGNKHEGSGLDWVQSKVRKELEGKKYLLVLDDVWNENRGECLKLGDFFVGGGRGSRIVVTTRSKETARVIGNGHVYVLQGLSAENSWRLFERLAFEQGQGEVNPDLVDIGKEIVRKCGNVPLAIRMVGTLLYGQNKTKWLAIQKNGLVKSKQGEEDITHILKLSYHHLDTRLKSCFSYCAIFPKDFVMMKEELISLWMAQGYVEPLYEGQSIDDAGDEYFSVLLRRCFFQDVETDSFGEIVSCKMHDLMHDIAQEVAGKDMANSIASKLDEKTRHIFVAERECAEHWFAKNKIRTFLIGLMRIPVEGLAVDALVANWKDLRALDLSGSGVKILPCMIGRLLHLRYLDLSYNDDLERLPEEMTELHNLQTLKLKSCYKLKELPRGLSKQVKLRVLDIQGCGALTCMPPGMDKLTCLRMLPFFLVAEGNSIGKQRVGQLEDIKYLNDLKGELTINILKNATYVQKDGEGEGEGGFLRNKHLNYIKLKWVHDENDERVDWDKAMMEDLQPHPNLRCLSLDGYNNVNTPCWARDDKLTTFLPNLVNIYLYNCKGLQHLPQLGRLGFLKCLEVQNLSNLVCMEYGMVSSYGAAGSRTAELPFFPSLEKLQLCGLWKLKGWWWREDDDMSDSSHQQLVLLPSFPRLSQLCINDCPNLTCIPLCPSVEILQLENFNERLSIMRNMEEDKRVAATPSSSSVSKTCHKLRYLETDKAGHLTSLPMEAFLCLSEMIICKDSKLKSLSVVEEIFQSCSSSLQLLTLFKCPQLKSLPQGMQHLTSLHSLTIIYCPQLKSLPQGMQHLSSLQLLQLDKCPQLKSLPDGIRKLTSLTRLEIWQCSQDLTLRCRNPDGEDWPKIQHIPLIIVDYKRCINGNNLSILSG